MRALAPPRSKMRVLATADIIAHWPLSEVSGTPVVDRGPYGTDLVSASTTNIIDGPFYGDPDNRGRTTTTASATGASTAAQRALMLGGAWTVEAWVRPSALSGTILVQGAAGDYSLVVQIGAGGFVRTQWTAGITVNVDTPTGVVAVGQLAHVGIRRRMTGGGTCAVDVFVNGVLVQASTALTAATGGSTGSWVIGASASGSARFNGDIFEVRVSGVFLSDDAIRESWARGVRDYDHATLYASGHYEVFGRALIGDSDGTWIDLSALWGNDWIDSIEWSDEVDDQGVSATLSMRREIYDFSTVPTRTLSALNGTTAAGELLRLTAIVRLEVAVVPLGTGRDGVALSDWLPVMRGMVVGLDTASDPIKVELYDLAAALQDVWIEPDRATSPPTDRSYGTAGGTMVVPELQAIIDDNEPPTVGYVGGTPTIYSPVASGIMVREWTTAPSKHVFAELQSVVEQFGWDIRYRWDDVRHEWRLTFSEPPRTRVWTSGDPVVDASTIIERNRLEVSRDDIRNVVEVEYGDEDPDHPGTIKRDTVVVTNGASITKYGRRYCRIGLGTDSQVNDLAGATAIANAALSDLSAPLADAEVLLPFRHHLEVHDVVKCLADGIHFDVDTTLATVGISQKVQAGTARTTLTQRGTVPSGARWRWFDVISVVGHIGGSSTTPPAAPLGFTGQKLAGGVSWRWEMPKFRGNRRYRETEVHWSTTSGFTPTAATLREIVRGRSGISVDAAPGVQLYGRIGHRDAMGNISAWSPQVAVTPRQMPATAHARVRRSTNQTLSTGGAFQTIVWNAEDVDALSRHNTATGEYTALSSGLLDVDARALVDTASKPATNTTLAVYVNGGQVAVSPTVSSSGTPDRAQVALRVVVAVNVGDAVTVRVSCAGNVGLYVVPSATNSRAWFTPISED